MPAAGGEPEALVQTARRAAFPFAVPDGSGLIYAANPDTSELALWWRGPGGTTHRITTGIGDTARPRIG